jgi:predicted SAM-dependent methyltransferase
MLKINLGCGTNRLHGWDNHDDDVDITKPLPWADRSADFIFAEHVVEHVAYEQALSFFRECRRVLKGGGVVRIAVPSIEQVLKYGNQAYFSWVHDKGWAPTPHARGAIDALLHRHGHQAPWTMSLLIVSLYYAGFDRVVPRDPLLSDHKELRNVEGHGKVIGEAFNAIETIVCEAS